ncbi:MAG TPA: Mbeg1-like protein [Aridibacter sp.]|nr:Mbeg1-like protein [Aridibacter sp.]
MPTLSFAETKSVCEVAYHGELNESFRFPDGNVWRISRTESNWMSGFKAAVIQGNGKTVLAFAGTDSLVDVAADIAQVFGGVPSQYREALLLTGVVSRSASGLILAGHSLGGGLAAYCSVHTRLRAYTVNPAPLIGAATLSALVGSHPQITNFVAEGGEFVSSSPGRNPGIDVEIPSSGNVFTRHSLGNVDPSVPLPTRE